MQIPDFDECFLPADYIESDRFDNQGIFARPIPHRGFIYPRTNCGFLQNSDSLVDHRVYVKILANGVSVEVMGKVIRTKKVIADGCKRMGYGIQFAEISPQMRWLIFSFAAIVDIGPSR
jgi:hypothetical protein